MSFRAHLLFILASIDQKALQYDIKVNKCMNLKYNYLILHKTHFGNEIVLLNEFRLIKFERSKIIY